MDVDEELKFLGKLKKKNFFFFLGGVRGDGGVGLGGQAGCERRIFFWGGSGGDVLGGGGHMVDVNKELKFL